MAVESTSIRRNELVSIRATTGGTTRAAAISVTPRTFMLARMAKLSSSISSASIRDVFTPDTSATSGSKVVNSSGR